MNIRQGKSFTKNLLRSISNLTALFSNSSLRGKPVHQPVYSSGRENESSHLEINFNVVKFVDMLSSTKFDATS